MAKSCHEFAEAHGFAVLILDWQELPLPQLAVAMAAAGQEVIEKYFSTLNNTEKAALGGALAVIRAHTVYEGCLSHLKQSLCVASVSYQMALKANMEFLHTVFANRRKAKLHFGQALCPNETTALVVKPRSQLVAQIQEKLTQTSSKVLFILGGEGVGKSWIVAQTWLGLIEKPIFLFCNPEMFLENFGTLDIERLLIKKLIEQTGDNETTASINRWQRRLRLWRQAVPQQSELVFWLDGINQQSSVQWERAINLLYDYTEARGIKLIITCRQYFYDTQLLPQHDYPVDKLMIPQWTAQQRDEILVSKGV
ncbi:MAG: hypothetical protein MJK04_13695, partial [Psychrosphaera sp.]|nr:hypothetical protein [Psychrosphaera sp.]